MFAELFKILADIFKAYKLARAERAAKDTAKTKPFVDHADAAADEVAAELRRAGVEVVPAQPPKLVN